MITKITPDLVEKWAEWLDHQPKTTALTEEQMLTFVLATMHESKIEANEELKNDILNGGPSMERLFYNRVKACHTYTITFAVALAMASITRTPGEVTMYANYLQYKAKKMGKGLLRMQDIGMHILPYGVFSRDTMREAWDRQKCSHNLGSDNILDHNEAQGTIEIKQG
ncbi:hypothetical protein [Muribaculum sp.]|uniref:hypothetical protein n=1 Tax=Muribaculum sp. TaxID=1918611 RepID=UPI00258B1B05|nr:hypothetical protein [Muribaculum sp.]MCX4278966.1 hypothetical protein [Muribaculum sp.]